MGIFAVFAIINHGERAALTTFGAKSYSNFTALSGIGKNGVQIPGILSPGYTYEAATPPLY